MNLIKLFLTTIAALIFLASPAFAQNTVAPTVKDVVVQFPVDQLQEMASCAKSQSKMFDTILSGNIGDPGETPQPLVTTCTAGIGESCTTFGANCLTNGGYYEGDGSGGICCSGVDHPDNNPNSVCS